jgi:hypothetical protein
MISIRFWRITLCLLLLVYPLPLPPSPHPLSLPLPLPPLVPSLLASLPRLPACLPFSIFLMKETSLQEKETYLHDKADLPTL